MRTLANKILFILLACAVGFTGCGEKFEEVHDELALDYTRFNLSTDGGEFAFMVYFDGDWTISLDKEVEWMRLEKTSGTGVTPVHIYFDENHLFKRTVNMTISGGGVSKVIAIAQKPAVETPIFTFVENGIKLTKGSYRVKTIMKSNLSEIAIKSQLPTVSYELGGEGWISNFDVEKISDDYVVEGGTAVYNYYIKFDITANDSGEERAATLKYTLSDEEGNEYGNEVLVIQGTEEGKLIIKESIVRGCGAKEYSEEITGGLERFEEDIEIEVSENDLIDKVWIADGRLYYTLKENTGTERREAVITLKYAAGEITATITIIQTEAGIDSVYEISTPADLLAWNKDAKNWAADDYVVLLNDIDCTGAIDASKWNVNTNFTGTFDGNDKTIRNFVLEGTGSVAFIGSINGDASVKDLTFDKTCSIKTSAAASKVAAAMLAATVTGNASIENIVNYGTVTADGKAAGSLNGSDLGGLVAEFNSTGHAQNCKNYGSVTFCVSEKPAKWTDVGGVFGKVSKQTDVDAGTIIGCENYGEVKFDCVSNNGQSINLGGLVGGGSGAAFTECKNFGKVSCNTTEAAGGGTNIGGIIGLSNANFCGLIKDCSNSGELINTGMTSGEIRMGGCIAFVQNLEATIEGFVNTGKVANEFETSAPNMLGGVAGRLLAKGVEQTISGCQNSGVVYSRSNASDKAGGVGGIVGYFTAVTDTEVGQSTLTLEDCSNTGNVTLYGMGTGNCHIAGIIGNAPGANATGSVINCSNSGTIQNGTTESTETGKWIYTGGIIGNDKFVSLEVVGCNNSGDVINGVHSNSISGNIRVGGITGNTESTSTTFKNNTNSGTIKDLSLSRAIDLGGIVGRLNTTSTMTGCSNTGNIISENKYTESQNDAWVSMGGIIGRLAKDNFTMENCTNNCTLENKNTTLKNEIMGGILGYGAKKAVIKSCSSKAIIINSNTQALRSGVFGGTWVAGFTVSDCSTGGKYGDTTLDSSNYKTYTFGSGSTFKDTANISFAE